MISAVSKNLATLKSVEWMSSIVAETDGTMTS